MTFDGRHVLAIRVAELDAARMADASTQERLQHVATVMQMATNTQFAHLVDEPPGIDAVAADAVVSGSRLLRALDEAVPAVVSGPFDPAAQQWVATGDRAGRPDPRAFRRPALGDDPASAARASGLFTSTATAGGPAMWRLFLDLYHGSDLYPLPWAVWALPPRSDHAPAVAEIRSAQDWVAFLDRYPHRIGDRLHPNWAAAAADWDGVHLTLRAVVAIQSFVLSCHSAQTAPVYWDVETTYWLRWAFGSPHLVETVH